MNLMVHPEINENAWSAVTTTDAGRSILDARRIYIGGIMKSFQLLFAVFVIACMLQSGIGFSGSTNDQSQTTPKIDKLIELLLSKNVISNDEAADLKKELIEKKEEPKQKSTTPPADNDVDMLLNLLIDKGVITPEEASAFRAELAIKKQEQKEKQKDFHVIAGRLVQLSAWAQVRYQHDPSKIDTFDVRRARLEIKGDVTEHFDYRFQADFGGGTVKLLDAMIGYKFNPALKLTFGQYKIPFSQENLISSAILDTINRSQVVEALVARSKDVIGNQNGRDIGLMAGGRFSTKDNRPIFDYALGIFDGAGINATDTNDQKDFVGRLVFFPLKNLSAGGSVYTGKYTLTTAPTKKDTRQRAGFEFAYTTNRISFKGEYIKGKDGLIKKDGWYLQAGYFVIPAKLQGLLKVDTFDPDTVVKKNETTVYTLGANWFVRQFVMAQINYEIKKEKSKEIDNNALSVQVRVKF